MSLLDPHVALAKETTYGTAVTTSLGLLTNPQDWDIKEEWQNVMTGVRIPGQEVATTTLGRVFMGGAGAGKGELLDKGMGMLLENSFGSFVDAVHPTEATMRRSTITPSVSGKVGKSLSVQLFKPFMDTLGRAFTWKGVKVVGIKLMCDVGGNVQYAVTVDGADMVTSGRVITASITTASANVTVTAAVGVGIAVGDTVTGTGIPASTTVLSRTSSTVFVLSANATATNASASLTIARGTVIAKAAPTYASNAQPYTWNGHSILTLDGIAASCTGWEVGWDFKLATGRRFMPGAGIKLEPVATGELSGGTLTLKGMEYLELQRQHDRFSSLTSASALAAFALTVSTASPSSVNTASALSITIPTALSKSGPPDMKGQQPADFDILGSTPLTITWDSVDAAP